MGHAEATAIAVDNALLLRGGYDVSYIERTAAIVHASTTAVSSDLLTRSRIEMINESTSTPNLPETQLTIHDWIVVPQMLEQEMDVGLGLGLPDAIRRTGWSFGVNEMVLLPVNLQAQAWDVQVELRRDWMSMIQRDEPLRGFLLSVAL